MRYLMCDRIEKERMKVPADAAKCKGDLLSESSTSALAPFSYNVKISFDVPRHVARKIGVK